MNVKKNQKKVAWIILLITIMSFSRYEKPKFYYAYNEKIHLNVVEDKFLVRFKHNKQYEVNQSSLFNDPKFKNLKWKDDSTIVVNIKSIDRKNFIEKIDEQLDVFLYRPMYKIETGLEIGVTNEILVKFKKNVSQNEIDQLHKKYKVKIIKTNSLYQLLEIPVENDIFEVANKYQESGLTRFSHPNFICKSEINSIPNDPYFNKQFYLHNTGQIVNDGHSGTNDADIDALEAWNITKGNYDIIIAVLDEGVTSNHPDLPNTRQVRLNGSNFHFGNPNNPSPTDNQNHGNACAGVIAASQNNNQGITGIVPNCRIMPIRMIGASAQKHADAIKFAWENGADILSCSWTFESDNPNLVPVIKDAIIEATTQGRNGKGCVVAFAAGNNENQNGIIKFPSNVEVAGVITVGASDRYDLQAQYSPTSDPESGNNQIIDIVAPSHRAYSNQISTETWEVWSIDIPNSSGYNTAHRNDGGSLPLIGEVLPSSGTNYLSYTGRFGGTSAACPQVSAVAAMLLSINPLLTQQEVFSIIKSTADDVGPYDYRLGRCDELGSGRLNACKAALEAISTNGIITGPDRVCYSNTTFSFISPPETVVSWTKSNNIQYVSGQGSPVYTIKANSTSSGPGWIQATISCPDCEPLVYRKEIWVGRPNFTLIGESELEPYSPGVVIISDINGNPIEAGSPNDPQISSVDWSYTGPLDYINGDTEKAYFRASRTGGNGIIYALATNQCGSLESRFYFEVVDIFFKIFPNPVDKYMDIELTNEALYISEKKPADIKIFNNRSVLIYSDNLSNSKLRINTSYLPNGLYVIQVKYDGKIYSKQVLIEH